jgi:hypothetical protein
LALCFRSLSCWKVNLSPTVCWKADWTMFSTRILPVLSSIPFFILKNSLVLANDKYTHNMMQPPPCLKIWRVILSDVLCWICLKHNTLYSEHKVHFCSFTSVPYCKQDTWFVIIVVMLSLLLCHHCTQSESMQLIMWLVKHIVNPEFI